jgi:hypothetical protein
MTFLALPWFVLVTTGSAAKMSIVLAVEILPVALLGIPSGALISRLGARTTMIIGDAARAPLMLAIPLLDEAGLLTFPLLPAVVFALGCFFAPYFSAQRLILPELVGDDEHTVAQANAVVEGTQRATSLLGPSLARGAGGAARRWAAPYRLGAEARAALRGDRGVPGDASLRLPGAPPWRSSARSRAGGFARVVTG